MRMKNEGIFGRYFVVQQTMTNYHFLGEFFCCAVVFGGAVGKSIRRGSKIL